MAKRNTKPNGSKKKSAAVKRPAAKKKRAAVKKTANKSKPKAKPQQRGRGGISANVATSKRGQGKTKPVKPAKLNAAQRKAIAQANTGRAQLRSKGGQFISKKATEAVLKAVAKSKSKTIDYRDFLNSKKVKGFIKTMVITDSINTPSLSVEIKRNKAKSKKFVIIGVNGERTETRSQKEALVLINQYNSQLYDILDIIEENEGKIDSPQFRAQLTLKTTKDEKRAIISIDYSRDDMSPTIDPDTWKTYRDFYVKENIADEDFD